MRICIRIFCLSFFWYDTDFSKKKILLVWQWLRQLGTFLHHTAHVYSESPTVMALDLMLSHGNEFLWYFVLHVMQVLIDYCHFHVRAIPFGIWKGGGGWRGNQHSSTIILTIQQRITRGVSSVGKHCRSLQGGKKLHHNQPLKQHAYFWTVTCTVQWANSFWECTVACYAMLVIT